MRNIVKTDLLLITRNLLINLLKQRNQFVNESLPFLVQQFTITRHLLLPKFQQRNIRLLLHFQQSISLLQSLIIVGQSLYIRVIILRDDHIHQFSALFTSPFYQRNIRRRNQNQRDKPNMLRKTLILLLVSLEMLLGTPFHATVNIFYLPLIVIIISLQHKERLIMSNNLGIDRIIGTPTEREIVDSIKEISLSHAIMSYQTIDFGRQLQIGALYIFKVNNGNIL